MDDSQPDLDIELNDADRPRIQQADTTDLSPRALASGRHLIDVHDMYRAELANLVELVSLVREGRISAAEARLEMQEMTLLQRDWAVACARYCSAIHSHHTLEDRAMFPALREFDEELEPVIDRLALEHEAVHQLVMRIDTALMQFARQQATSEHLELLVDRLAKLLTSHFAYEEEQLVIPLARLGLF